jgi:hypothetical protein
VNKDHCLHPVLACTVMEDETTTARILRVGDGGDCSVLIACRNDENREYIDSALLPDGVKIAAESDSLLPQRRSLPTMPWDSRFSGSVTDLFAQRQRSIGMPAHTCGRNLLVSCVYLLYMFLERLYKCLKCI